jgi:hypothetical protein
VEPNTIATDPAFSFHAANRARCEFSLMLIVTGMEGIKIDYENKEN